MAPNLQFSVSDLEHRSHEDLIQSVCVYIPMHTVHVHTLLSLIARDSLKCIMHLSIRAMKEC